MYRRTGFLRRVLTRFKVPACVAASKTIHQAGLECSECVAGYHQDEMNNGKDAAAVGVRLDNQLNEFFFRLLVIVWLQGKFWNQISVTGFDRQKCSDRTADPVPRRTCFKVFNVLV